MATTYSKEVLADAVLNSTSVMGVLRYLGRPQAGGTHAYLSKKIKEFGLDTTHFTGSAHNKNKTYTEYRKPSVKILCLLPDGSRREKTYLLKRAMLEAGLTYGCGCGNIGLWQGEPITLEIDHLDGNWLNNKIENLRFLCPNCHSQQKTAICLTNTELNNAHVVEWSTRMS